VIDELTMHTRAYMQIVMSNMSRLCHTMSMVTVNGSYLGPTVYVCERDRVVVAVNNCVAAHNVVIHWHGLKQRRNGWTDGPAYVMQCPIQPGATYAYDLDVTGQRGTLWWHVHVAWLCATVHGAIVVLLARGVPYPFPKPNAEAEIILGS
jgi:laccase